ncbi:MAG: protein kinase [bacterium]|nr:protein kinase [bacterium]
MGRKIGEFEIIREIGRGGMGTVYLAQQKSLNRVVALKVLSSGLGLTGASVLRFQREAQAAASLHHQNIVPIHALGETDGVYYYAMEYIRGESLYELICRARDAVDTDATAVAETEPLGESDDLAATVPIPVPASVLGSSDPALSHGAPVTAYQFEKIAGLIASVADALDYAHRRGIIHRDVKPHNLILGEDERMYILDFGLARVLEQPGVTTTGEFVGSPLYMSPEQITGRPQGVDPRTDTYSLGATLHEWLTLSPPYPGETREQVISKIITSDVQPSRTLNPHIPEDLETICAKALEKDPRGRYQSAAEMRDDLRRFQTHDRIRARRTSILGRAGRFLGRHQVASLATVALAVALTLVAALVVQSRRLGDAELSVASSAPTVESAIPVETDLSQPPSGNDRVTTAPPPGPVVAETGTETPDHRVARKLLESAEADRLAKLLAVMVAGTPIDPLAQRFSQAFIDRLRAYESQRLETRLGPGFAAVDTVYVTALATADLEQASTLVGESLRLDPGNIDAEQLAGALACARQDFANMLARAEVVVRNRPGDPDGFLLRGAARLFTGDLEFSQADLGTALELGEASSWARTLRGVALQRSRDYPRALRDFEGALAASANNVAALLGRAQVKVYLHQHVAAVADLVRVIELEPENTDAYVLRGDCFDAQGRYAEAAEDYTQALSAGGFSTAISTKLAGAIVRREQQASTATPTPSEPAGKPAETPEPEAAPTQPPPSAGVWRTRADWLRRLLRPQTPDRLKDTCADTPFGYLLTNQQ